MATAAKLHRDDREAERFVADMGAELRNGHAPLRAVTLIDISAGGVALTTAMDLPVGATVGIELPSLEARHMLVVHREDERYGCRFVHPLSTADIALTIDAGARATRWPVRMPAEAPAVERASAAAFLACLAVAVAVVFTAMVALT